MTNEQFLYWLNGYLTAKESLTKEDVVFIMSKMPKQTDTTLTPYYPITDWKYNPGPTCLQGAFPSSDDRSGMSIDDGFRGTSTDMAINRIRKGG